jgi:hypothetical protein
MSSLAKPDTLILVSFPTDWTSIVALSFSLTKKANAPSKNANSPMIATRMAQFGKYRRLRRIEPSLVATEYPLTPVSEVERKLDTSSLGARTVRD